MHRASKKSNLAMIQLLLKFSPDLNSCDFYGKTPLSYAIEQDNIDIAKVTSKAKSRFLCSKGLFLGMIRTLAIRICARVSKCRL